MLAVDGEGAEDVGVAAVEPGVAEAAETSMESEVDILKGFRRQCFCI